MQHDGSKGVVYYSKVQSPTFVPFPTAHESTSDAPQAHSEFQRGDLLLSQVAPERAQQVSRQVWAKLAEHRSKGILAKQLPAHHQQEVSSSRPHTDAESNGPDMQQTARLEQPVSSPSSEHEYDHQVDVDFPDAADATGSADIDIDSRPAPPAELFGSQALHPASVSSPSQSIPHLTASQHNQNTDPVGEQDSDTDDDEDDDADMVLDVQQGAAPAHEMPPDQALLRRDCSPLCISIGNGWFIMQDYEPSGVQGHPGTCVLAACSLGQYMCLLIITFKLAHKCCLVCSVT